MSGWCVVVHSQTVRLLYCMRLCASCWLSDDSRKREEKRLELLSWLWLTVKKANAHFTITFNILHCLPTGVASNGANVHCSVLVIINAFTQRMFRGASWSLWWWTSHNCILMVGWERRVWKRKWRFSIYKRHPLTRNIASYNLMICLSSKCIARVREIEKKPSIGHDI